MLADKDRIFTNLYGMFDRSLAGRGRAGTGTARPSIIGSGRDKIVEEVKASGLRGRGGAGFPTGLKWSFMPKGSDGRPHYLVVNADESEPGTCKDREIMRHDPHTLVEGCLIAGFGMGAHAGYIYMRGEYIREREALQVAIDECYDAGLLGPNACGSGWDFDLYLHHGAGAYICGEETALLESLEGRKGMPRLKPPFPANTGLYGCADHGQQRRVDRGGADDPAPRPRLVRELRAAEQRRDQGLCGVGAREPALRRRGRDVDHAAGADRQALRRGQGRLEEPQGGDSGRVFGAAVCRQASAMTAIMDFDWLREQRSGLGTAAVIVMDQSTDVIKAIWRLSKFYKHESCGQCTPCREGTGWMMRVMDRLVTGEAEPAEIDMLLDVTKQVEGHTICALGDAAAWPIQGLIRHFRDEIEDRIKAKRTGRISAVAAE